MANIDDNFDFDNDVDEVDTDDAQKDKYITFKLGVEEYAIEIMYVSEIIGMQKFNLLPDMPDFIKGVINLRGRVFPIIDVRKRFKLEEVVYDERTCIILVSIVDANVGLIVDEVSEVLDISSDQVEPAPMSGKKSSSRFIKGIGKVGDKIKIILNVDMLLNDDEIQDLMEIS
jgi:purine-binding chemotaxis protein CheW